MAKKLIMTRGLPGSGKSTWAREERVIQHLAGRKVEIVCKDEIRKGLTNTGWTWSEKNEADVIRIRDVGIRSAFDRGIDIVIVADTNFGKHKERLQQIAKGCGADFEVKDFTHVSVEECIARDEKRAEHERVGAKVIKEMFNKYLATNEVVKYKPDVYAQKAIICELDGKIALHGTNRSP